MHDILHDSIEIIMTYSLNNCVFVFTSLVVILSNVHSFKIIQNTVISNLTNNTIEEGENVILKCVASNWYEFCSWKHDDNICKFEWKRSSGSVQKQNCDHELNDSIRFLGNYNKHECSIQLSNLSLSDVGEWTCELESYVWGPISGNKDKAVLNLMVGSSESDYNQTISNATQEGDDEDDDEEEGNINGSNI